MRRKRLIQLGYLRLRASIVEHLFRYTGIDFTLPIFIRASVTDRCNYRCQYCSHWRQEAYPDEMSLDDWQLALTNLKKFVHPFAIQFLGGEPFVWPPFLQLVEFCRASDIDWGVITNGSALNAKTVERLVASQPLNIDISIDSVSSKIHDEARGVIGSLTKIQRGIGLLRDAQERTGHRFPIRIKPTVHRLNMGELVNLVEWSEKVGASSIDFSPVRLWRKEDIDALWVNSPDEFTTLQTQVEGLIKLKREGSIIETSEPKLRGMVAHFRGSEVRHGAVNCRAAMRDFLIRPDGRVIVCKCFPALGNVRQTPARLIWQSSASRNIRRDSLVCKAYTEPAIATSCLAHRALLQDAMRLMKLYSNEIFAHGKRNAH